jgi:para-nitrobenzyl esterase
MRADGVSRFLGIPYGADTTSRRFQPAGAPKTWTGVRDCFTFGPMAPQGSLNFGAMSGASSGPPTAVAQVITAIFTSGAAGPPESENCLTLNVYTPDASPARKRPVMVWLHGGGFAVGTASTANYDGGGLCRRGDIVVVTVNHRLNALGYLYLGALHDDFADSGNVGQLDIVLALEWVRDNIAAFGGDPHNVTIFGESGGGSKVGTLLGMRPAKGLFHKAIQQSGPVVKLVEKTDAEEIAERTLASLGMAKADVHKLQTMDYKDVIKAATAVRLPGSAGAVNRGLAPCVDGRSVPAHPFDPVATDISRDVPLIIGTNKDEMTLMMGIGKMTEQQARQRFAMMLGPERGSAAFEMYRKLKPADQPTYWVTSMATDQIMRGNSIIEAERKAAQKAAPVFMYRFDWESPVADGALRAFHGIEVPFVFDNGTGSDNGTAGNGAQREALTTDVSGAWIAFAHTGNPSRKGLQWPRYDANSRTTMIFNTPSKAVSDPDRESRLFWTAS